MFEFSLPSSALPLTAPYLRAVLVNNSAEALRLILDEGLGAGVSPSLLQLRVIVPAQREIGRLWQENRVSVAQEHLATSISQLVMSRLYPHLPRSTPNGCSVIVACVPGELHDVGARIGADFLEMAGFQVHFLGANVPIAKLLDAVEAERPDLLGLSASMNTHLPALRSTLAALRSVAPSLPIVLGGGLLEAFPALASELDLQAFGASADALAETCRLLLGLSVHDADGRETA